jgi:predicted O-linked N-acetylglucosamine transferase (SPINDLY family)
MDQSDLHRQMVGRAIQLQKSGQLAQAEAVYESVLQANPSHADALNLYGCLCDAKGQTEKGAALVRRATESNPAAYPYFCNLANMLAKLGRADEAEANYQKAISLKPDYAQAYNNLGVLKSQQGDPAGASKCFERAIDCLPSYADPHFHLGMHYRTEKNMNAAVAALRRAISLRPDHADAHYNLAITYTETAHFAMAVEPFQTAIRLRPQVPAIHTNLGAVLMRLGRMDEAAAAFREACRLAPLDLPSHSNLILLASYVTDDPAVMHAECVQWETIHGRSLGDSSPTHKNLRQPKRRLRIGYVSADLRQHAAAYWIEPLLEGHSAGDFDVVCYNNSREAADDVSTRLKALVDEWVDCAHLSDDALAERIRQDRIDILVDLSGHTEGNRLLAFAQKPAPVQVSWFGFPVSTGLHAIDYRLTNQALDPEGESEPYYSETLVRLGRFYAAFRPDPMAPEPGEAPVHRNGYITFGSFNNFTKITPAMLELWCDMVRCTPNSKILLQAGGLDNADLGNQLRTFFAQRGVEPARLMLRGWTDLRDYLALGREVDIALDPFPFNGGVTTCHSLWMGLPVVTLSGRSAASRVGRGILGSMGLMELVASSTAQYRQIALDLARDADRLAQLRGSLRERMRNAGLLDGLALAREAETAYRTMWRTWCASGSQQ